MSNTTQTEEYPQTVTLDKATYEKQSERLAKLEAYIKEFQHGVAVDKIGTPFVCGDMVYSKNGEALRNDTHTIWASGAVECTNPENSEVQVLHHSQENSDETGETVEEIGLLWISCNDIEILERGFQV